MSAKKEVTLILIILLFATATYAACDLTDTINEGLHITPTVKGKDYNISFTSYINGSAKFKVNGISVSDLTQGDKHSFNDLSELTITSISGSSGSSTATICFNAGLSGKAGTCSSSLECDDGNPCTINECDGDPLRCHRTLILWCRDNDGCCPESRCTPEKDNDCAPAGALVNVTGNITTNESINDSSTEDIINITECISRDDYCPDGCTFESDTDCDECSTDDDCNDDNACTLDICSSSTKKCAYTTEPGCNLNGECLSIETRIETHFCHTDNTMRQFREKEESCDNDYECLNNHCKENICKGDGFFKGIINWFKGLFGK